MVSNDSKLHVISYNTMIEIYELFEKVHDALNLFKNLKKLVVFMI